MPATRYPVGAGHARDHLRNKAQCLPDNAPRIARA